MDLLSAVFLYWNSGGGEFRNLSEFSDAVKQFEYKAELVRCVVAVNSTRRL